MINQKELKYLLNYNAETGLFTWLQRMANGKIKPGDIAGANRNGYIDITINRKIYGAHRLAWLYVYGELPTDYIDHQNGNPSDNRIENLRISTNQQNQWNQKISKNNTSGVKGVCWNKALKKYSARISIEGKRKFLGLFESLEFAELVVNEARNKYHGNFSRNF